ncbi:hypothetical protein [Flavobacterium soli]|uniref:hypothetical protein n=1 Tax=Flavobacterium soli TaxID=344881 RepID=UPI0004061172|nr:hypothetical protein [Flavobacterium soli]
MKKYILVLVLFLNVALAFADDDGAPPPPDTDCECCIGLPPAEESDCLIACEADPEQDYCDTVVPIDSNILILLALGISFGTYTFYQINKKRQFEN